MNLTNVNLFMLYARIIYNSSVCRANAESIEIFLMANK